MKVLKLFLASSSELKKDRGEFRVFISEENKVLVKRNLFIQVELWEDFIDSMAQSSLQDTYNRAVRSCDFFVMLFYSKVGKYTREEFETAFGQFQETNKPFIYTYFKNSTIRIGDLKRDDIQSLWEFQDRLQALGHYQTLYENMGTLKLHFKNQLHKHLAKIETENIGIEEFPDIFKRILSNDNKRNESILLELLGDTEKHTKNSLSEKSGFTIKKVNRIIKRLIQKGQIRNKGTEYWKVK